MLQKSIPRINKGLLGLIFSIGVLLFGQASTYAAMILTHTEFSLPDGYSRPFSIKKGSDDSMWFWATKDDTSSRAYGKITADGEITMYDSPNNFTFPVFHAVGSDGNLWFTESEDVVGYVTPSGVLQTYNRPFDSLPMSMTADQSGNLWFAERRSHKIGYIVPGQPIVTFNAASLSGPSGVIMGPDGKVWFLETFGNKIKSITPDGTITEIVDLAAFGVSPSGLIIDPSDNKALVTMNSNGRVVKIDANGATTTYDLQQNDGIRMAATASGPNERLWYTNTGVDGYGYKESDWDFVTMNSDKKIQSFAQQCDRLWYASTDTSVLGYISGIVTTMNCPWSPDSGGSSGGANNGGSGEGAVSDIKPPSTGYAATSNTTSTILLYMVLLCSVASASVYGYTYYARKR